ncbi:MAG: UvrD-helicase domain-containing protein [Planctomycetia bacterium]|jgi:DNA helicase-2/ATP-dependent DNA helicase PcrA
MDRLLQNLTPTQIEAVTHTDGPLMILAGPGSGKTRVVTHRVAHLIKQGVPAWQILALTFTNKAADEMKARVANLVPGESVWVGTFHRFCSRLLRKHAPAVGLNQNFSICDTSDSRLILKRALESLGFLTPKKIKSHIGGVADAISWAKNNLVSPQDYVPRGGNELGELVQMAYPAYQEQLIESNSVDFDDLLMHVATVLRENDEIRMTLDRRYRYILVDEYQDTNLAQYLIARALSVNYPNLAVTGDPDQSIYSWRGANLQNILSFENDFPDVRVVRLERNYRSTQRILDAAGTLIANNVKRKEKELYTKNGEGDPVRLAFYPDQNKEADDIADQIELAVARGERKYGDFAIFYRINALSWPLEHALRKRGVPFQMVHGLEFFQRKEIKDLVAYLHLLNNPRSSVAFLRVINTPTRGIGKTSIKRLDEFAGTSGISLLEAAREAEWITALTQRAKTAIKKFVAMVDRLAASVEAPMEELLGHILVETDYRSLYKDQTEEDEQRLANIEQLLTVGREFDEMHGEEGTLEDFLEQTSLVADTDDWEEEVDRVTLMTLHASKGLEFPCIYIVAVEDEILPHSRSKGTDDEFEEERRLLFVGITRAMEELQLSLSEVRDFRGRRELTIPSPFLMELPREQIDWHSDRPRPSWASGSGFYSAPEPADIWNQERVWDEHETADPASKGDGEYTKESWDDPLAFPPHDRRAAAANEAKSGEKKKRKKPSGPPIRLTTAAEMAGESPGTRLDPDEFYQGMVVCHPEHGVGGIVALSGAGDARKATIDFGPAVGRKKMVLAKSDLKPLMR